MAKRETRTFRPLSEQLPFLEKLEKSHDVADIMRAAVSLLMQQRDPVNYVTDYLKSLIDLRVSRGESGTRKVSDKDEKKHPG